MYDDDEIKELLTKRKILSIPYHEILESIMKCCPLHTIKNRKELPEGYMLTGVYYDPMTYSFNFVICHDSFDVISAGEIPPQWDDITLTQTTYRLEQIE